MLGPKVYMGITNDDKVICKVKGYKNKVEYSLLKELLDYEKVLKLQHSKSYRNIIDSNIEIKKQLYNLQVTDSKREVVYENGKLVYTKPYFINDDKTIKNLKRNIQVIQEEDDK